MQFVRVLSKLQPLAWIFNLAIKKVVGEGKEIESTWTTKKYVHPDRPDIFVEVDLSTG